ncbi:MAG: acyltransferase [Actinomycetota bacterium]|nr:acyltransferase [Actinomycetota bacterium]
MAVPRRAAAPPTDPCGTAPSERDRVVDLVRAASILVVVLGHWTMAAVERDGADGIRLGNVLEVSPWLHPATWVLQVMPLFFFAAGFTNALALDRRGRGARTFLSGRLGRVLRPTLPFVAVWLLLAWALIAMGVPPDVVDTAGANAAIVLWFLAVYLVLALVAPAQVAVHRRFPWLLVAVLPLVALALDGTQGSSWAGLGFLNYVVVFAFCQELGLLYADRRLIDLPRRAWWLVLAGSGALLVAATALGPYPVSMIDLPGQAMSNMLPPSVCVVLVGVLQVALLMVARPRLHRWLRRPRPWRATVAVNSCVVTIFLWHLTGFVAASGLLLGLGLPLPPVGTAAWWAHKVLWLAVAGASTVVLVRLMSWPERHPPRRAPQPAPAPGVLVGPGAALAAAGLAMLASAGFAAPFERGGIALAGVSFAAAPGVALIVASWVLSRWPARPSR